jgi:muramidase (phage lysozyme)
MRVSRSRELPSAVPSATSPRHDVGLARPARTTRSLAKLASAVALTLTSVSVGAFGCSSTDEEATAAKVSGRLSGEYAVPGNPAIAGIYFEGDRYVLLGREGGRSVGSFTFDDRVLRLMDASSGTVATIRIRDLGMPRPSSGTSVRTALSVRSESAPQTTPPSEGENGCQSDAFASVAEATPADAIDPIDAGAVGIESRSPGTLTTRGLVGGGDQGGAIVSGDAGPVVENDGGAILDPNAAAGLLCARVTATSSADTSICCTLARALIGAAVERVEGDVAGDVLSQLLRPGGALGDLTRRSGADTADGGTSMCANGDCDLRETAAGARCENNGQCNNGASGVGVVCSTTGATQGRCVEGCHSDADCAGGTCNKSGPRWRCSNAAPALETPCAGDNATCNGGVAGAGRVCSTRTNRCIVGCHTDADCSGGAKCDTSRPTWVCSNGRAEPASPLPPAGSELVRATGGTFLKTSTQDASALPEADKCAIAGGTSVTLTNVASVGRHIRARLAAAPPACAGKANFAVGREVYLFGDHFTGWTAPPAPPDRSSLPSCDPQRAVGAVEQYHYALHQAIAFAEGTRGRGEDGYNVIYSYQYVSNCDRHPNRVVCSGICSSAAGRYQFLNTTWNDLRTSGISAFNPEHQERASAVLIRRRGVTVPAGRAMNSTEFTNAMNALSWEWASLPPGRYGQPVKTLSEMRSDYCRNAGGC